MEVDMTRQYWANMALCTVMGALVIFAVSRMGSMLTPKGLFVSTPSPSHEAGAMMKKLLLHDFKVDKMPDNWRKGTFIIQNKGDSNVKNISILCEYFDKEGEGQKYLDRETWLLATTVPAKHSLQIKTRSKGFIHNGAGVIQCQITDFQMVTRPAFSLEKHVGGGHGKASEGGHGEQAPAGH